MKFSQFNKNCVVVCAVIAVAFTTAATNVFAQAKNQQTNQNLEVQILKPKMTVADVIFSVQMLDNVEIRGSEVDAFMDVRKVFVPIVEAAQRDKKAETDVVAVELSLGQAQNFITLVQRTRLTGAVAEKYKKVVDAIYEASNKDVKTGNK